MKFLIIRFSSIGDIVLTTPVVRCLKKQLPDSEIHFLTKESFGTIVENNSYKLLILAVVIIIFLNKAIFEFKRSDY